MGAFDRLTFAFTGGLPGYGVRYTTKPVTEDPSGRILPVKGDSALEVHFAGASTVDLSGGKVTMTYTGPKRFSPPTAAVVEVVEAGDFEDVLTWVVGTKGKPGYKVTTDSASNHIVLDVEHPPSG
jgi:hypothetical protein